MPTPGGDQPALGPVICGTSRPRVFHSFRQMAEVSPALGFGVIPEVATICLNLQISTETYPISLNACGPHGGSVWEWLEWSRKDNAIKSYLGRKQSNGWSTGSIPSNDYLIVLEGGRVFHLPPNGGGNSRTGF